MLAVAVCVVTLPFGAVKLKVTLAPEAGAPPLVTVAVIGTVPGGVKLVPDTEILTASESVGGSGGGTPMEYVAVAELL